MKKRDIKTVLRRVGIALTICCNLPSASIAYAGQTNMQIDQNANMQVGKQDSAASILKIANAELASLLAGYSRNQASLSVFELPKDTNIKSAKIAYGVQMYSVDPAQIVDGRRELKDVMMPTGDWRFIVSIDDSAIGALTMRKTGGKWSLVEFGASNFAKDADETLKKLKLTDKTNLKLLRINQATADFFAVSDPINGHIRFSPLQSAQRFVGTTVLKAQTMPVVSLAPAPVSNVHSLEQPVPLLEGRDLLQPLRQAIVRNNSLRTSSPFR